MNERETFEKESMGCTMKELKDANPTFLADRLMMAMSILSDTQELVHQASEASDDNQISKDLERARQYINRAKAFIIEKMEEDQKAGKRKGTLFTNLP